MNRRQATQIVRGKNAIDGAGVHLRRVLGIRTIVDFDPFLMLDGFDSTNPDDYTKGFPWHPHRGIETITYLIHGEIDHSDSLGNKGTINDLECQWMTAGSGIIHQEMPISSERMLGCQIWVNLPSKDKMTHPAYGDLTKDMIPVIKEDKATIRILSGKYNDQKGKFEGKYVNVTYLDIELAPDSSWSYSQTPNDQTLFIYLLDGTIASDENLQKYEDKACAILFTSANSSETTNDEIVVKSGNQGARFVLLAAKPIKETVAWGGPIVMNTNEELQLAFDELENNTFIKHK